MKYAASLKWLIPLIFLLALFAAAMGLFYQTPGQPYPLTTFRGEKVMINGHGLYLYDTVSSTAQMQANDLVTLVLGLPLLAISAWLAFRGSLRGQLLLTGTLAFILYTYISMSFNTAYNQLFLVYVALFSLSLFAFILSMMSYDVAVLPQRFSSRLPRRGIATLFIVTGIFLLLAWVGGRIMPTLLQNQIAPLENTTTLVIQAMDLGLIVPLAFLSAILLLRRSAWGYLLASVAAMKFLTMGIAVSAMGINMMLVGTPDSLVIVVIFILLTLVNLVMAYLLLKSIQDPPESRQIAQDTAGTAG